MSLLLTSRLAGAAAQPLAVDEDKVSPGLLGFLVVVLLGLATWFLLRSMNKQLRKVDFEERELLAGTDMRNDVSTGDAPGTQATDADADADADADRDNRP